MLLLDHETYCANKTEIQLHHRVLAVVSFDNLKREIASVFRISSALFQEVAAGRRIQFDRREVLPGSSRRRHLRSHYIRRDCFIFYVVLVVGSDPFLDNYFYSSIDSGTTSPL